MSRRLKRILVVDDEEAVCWALRQALSDEGYEAAIAASAEEALPQILAGQHDLVILDVRLPGMDGLTALRQIQEKQPNLPVVLITAFGNLRTAVAAVQQGAVEYLTKPFDMQAAVDAVRRALERRRDTAPAPVVDTDELAKDGILGRSPAMQAVFKQIAIVAATDLPVLITGESGTGKELVAQAVHRHSRRAEKPFLPVHLASLSPALIESELFGHIRGAFTGADKDRRGLLDLAHEATVFFDEAGDIPPPVQVKLLRVLEQREIFPVGDVHPRPADFRVIAATHKSLEALVAEGGFRSDLYYRIAGFQIHLPPLRERKEDIPLLAEFFLRRMGGLPANAGGFSEAALEDLRARPWPGNVRELRHVVENAALLARGAVIEPLHLPAARMPSGPDQAVGTRLADAVRAWTAEQLKTGDANNLYDRMLDQAATAMFNVVLDHTNGNRTAAAEILGIDRATLRKRLD